MMLIAKLKLPLIVTLLICGMIGFSSSAKSDEPWKLLPLEYNHEGLVVDLGVGLWAWPMPVDYDSDGDLDLLVACPDKPSNGVYYFENPTQDKSNRFPVFKPGIRVGKAGHNFQISYVNGTPRILQPGSEFPAKNNVPGFDFSRPRKLYPRSNVHANKVRGNMWRYVDFDGDGDHDIVVGAGDWTDYGWDNAYDRQGRWKNGPLHGFLYLISNRGTDDQPNYSLTPRRIKAAGADIDVYGWPSPNFGDFDGDGDLDLICGEFLDRFTYFQNIGSRSRPVYSAGIKLLDTEGMLLRMELQMITPTAIDWDSDGDLDLIVGDEDGRVALVENSGQLRNQLPRFKPPVYFKQQADTLKFGALATPWCVDWDQDGDQDILCGNTAGNIGFFENLGQAKNGMPSWAAPVLLKADGKVFRVQAGDNGSIQGPCEAKWGYTTLSVADWDQDGDLDILYNSILSRIGFLENRDGQLFESDFQSGVQESPPGWYWWNRKSPTDLTQWRTTPVAVDFDQDEKMDLVLLDQEGYLTLRKGGGKADRLFVDESLQPIRLNRRSCGSSGRVKLAVADWDGDNRLDVIVNSANATLYRNCETREGRYVLKRIGDLARRNVSGHTSSPAICDFDRDGKPDLLVGSENGRLYYIRHEDCVAYSSQQKKLTRQPKADKERIPGLVKEDFVFTRAKFPQCHASSICQTSRGMVAAWFGGTREKAKDVGIWVSYHDGNGWSAPKEWANGIQTDQSRHPCWNPVLYQTAEGPTLLFFKVGPSPSTWWGEMMVSYDGGRTFRDRTRLPEGIDGPVRCKPIRLKDGTLLCGSSTEYKGWRVHFEKVKLRNGLPFGTWQRIGPINDASQFNAIQPTILQHKDGRLQALCRTRESVIVSTTSEDLGSTWSPLKKTNLPNPNSGIEVVTLKDGRHLLIYNHLGTGKTEWGSRGMLNLAISNDGVTWKKVAVLEQEEKAEFSYPAIIQSKDGMIHLSYTWKRQRIKHMEIDPSKIRVGEAVGFHDWHSKPPVDE